MKIKKIAIWICQGCLDGIGQVCWTPGCALIRRDVGMPIHESKYEVLDELEEDKDDTHG